MSDLRKSNKNWSKEKVEKKRDFSHDLKKKEHIKPKIYSTNELPFNPNVKDIDHPPFNPNVLKSEEKPFNPNSEKNDSNNFASDVGFGGSGEDMGQVGGEDIGFAGGKAEKSDGHEDINNITINIDLSDDKKNQTIFTNSDVGFGGSGEVIGEVDGEDPENEDFQMKLGPDGPEEPNSIIINIDLNEIGKKDSNKFTKGFFDDKLAGVGLEGDGNYVGDDI